MTQSARNWPINFLFLTPGCQEALHPLAPDSISDGIDFRTFQISSQLEGHTP
jgi:hypothetical protein